MNLGEYLGEGAVVDKLILHLNGNSTDSSGNSNNGIDGNVSYSKNYGKFNEGALFSNQGSRIYANNTITLNLVTFSCWAKLTATNPGGARGYICLSKDGYGIDSVRSWGQWFFWNSGVLRVYVDVFSASFSVSSLAQINTWYNIVGTYDGQTIRAYVNGKLIGSAAYTGTIPSGSAKITVGNRHQTSSDGSGFTGHIDEVIIKNRAWTPQEVQKYYTESLGMFAIL